MVSATFDRGTDLWTVTTAGGEVFQAPFCIMATGNLSLPRVPRFPGLESFKGNWYHSGLWPEEGVDFSGRRVGVIGTGSSGIQMIPIIAEQARHLTVFQRTANFSVPAENRPITPELDRSHKEKYRYWRDEARRTPFGIAGHAPPTRSALEDAPEARERVYEEKWGTGGNISFLYAYNDLLVNKDSNETAAQFVRDKIRSIVRDPKVAELLSPRDHPIGTKRLCLDDGYFETFNRDNVTLVDVRSDPIVEITPSGLRTRTRAFELDDIAFATGFDAMTGALLDIDISVEGGPRLSDKWAHGPRTYLGLMTAGFPNLFMITGPGSPSVKSNMIASIEQHVDWIADCLQHLGTRGSGRSKPMKAPRTVGSTTSTRSPMRRSIRRPTRGTTAQTSRASRACSCRMSPGWTSTERSVTRSRQMITGASSEKRVNEWISDRSPARRTGGRASSEKVPACCASRATRYLLGYALLLRRPAIGLGAGAAHQHGPLRVAQAVGLEEGLRRPARS